MYFVCITLYRFLCVKIKKTGKRYYSLPFYIYLQEREEFDAKKKKT